MRAFEMHLRVLSENLTTVLDVLKDSADLISMTQIEDAKVASRVSNHTKKRVKGFTSRDLILETLREKAPRTIKEMVRLFEAKGFSRNSASPAINELIRGGKVKKIADGVYGLV